MAYSGDDLGELLFGPGPWRAQIRWPRSVAAVPEGLTRNPMVRLIQQSPSQNNDVERVHHRGGFTHYWLFADEGVATVGVAVHR